MPELPEVETIRRGLEPELVGRSLVGVEILCAKSMPVDIELINSTILGRRILALWRQGKVLGINLESDYSLLVHLKMTGQLILQTPDGERSGGGHPTKSMAAELPDTSTRVVFELEDGSKLFFNDQRKFGWIKLAETAAVAQDALLSRLGPEPSSQEFTPQELSRRITRRTAPIKAVLLDQSSVAGLGNIYVDESLHLAGIHPLTRASALNEDDVDVLHQAIESIIAAAIAQDGTTFRDYMNHRGEKGNYFDHARVFGRSGLPCPECGSIIEKFKVAGRGTHICSVCQVVKN